MMSRDTSELQRGVARFDHTLCCQVMHMHALCIVKHNKMLREERSQSIQYISTDGCGHTFCTAYSRGEPVLGSVLHDLLVSDTRIDGTDISCKA